MAVVTERTPAARLAWGVAAATFLLGVGSAVLLFVDGQFGAVSLGSVLLSALMVLTVGILGALVAARRPRNPVGWLMLAAAGLEAMAGFAVQLAIRALQEGAPVHGWVQWVGWGGSVSGVIAPMALILLSFLVFPDGRLPLRISRWAAASVVVVLGAITTLEALDPARIKLGTGVPRIANPVAVGAVRGFNAGTTTVGLLWFMVLIPLGLTLAALVIRLRRSRGLEHRQLSWVVYACAVSLAVGFLGILVATAAERPGANSTIEVIGGVAITIGLEVGLGVAVPAVMATTILRNRMYDIDRVVNRTLVYGALTAVLGIVYAGCVLGLGTIARSLGGGGSGRGIVVAASTLAVAALVRPLRRRVQSAIDRRFYRRRYDAARAIGSFASRLRTGGDLDSLHRDLVSVVTDTMQPATISVWLNQRFGPAELEPEAPGAPAT